MVKLICDSAADIPKNIADEYNISILPFTVNIDGKEIVADKNLDTKSFYEIIDASEGFPTTSQMSPSFLYDIYKNIGADTSIIHITMSSNGSGINNTANLVADELNQNGFDITVIDSGSFSVGIGVPAAVAAKMAQSGIEKQEIIDYLLKEYDYETAYFLVDDLTFLKKGGRIKATTMAISKVLDIKPILYINDGLVEAFKKVRGLKKALSCLADYAFERMENPEENTLYIVNSNAKEKAEALEQLIKERISPKEICHGDIGPVITSHAGTGLVGIYFKHKKPYNEYDLT